jgi:hypothetical protein
VRHNNSLPRRCRCFTHESFLKKVDLRNGHQISDKSGSHCKCSLRENGLPEGQMMPAMVRLNSVKTALRLG